MLPKYITKKINQQHKLLNKAQALNYEILDWYTKKISNNITQDNENNEMYEDVEFGCVYYIRAESLEHNINLP